jgi:hypothetical protein
MDLRSSDAASEPDNTGTMEKMTSFSMIRKKTPFQKHREEEEAKKKVWGNALTKCIELCTAPVKNKVG